MSQIELACDDVVFHFNKKHLEDNTIPMWVVKTKGNTYYVNHVSCSLPWSTKETPDNSHTKGSIKIKKCLLTISDDNEASIQELTPIDAARIRNQEQGITRIIVKEGSDYYKFVESLKIHKIKHSPMKSIGGACSSRFYITDIIHRSQFTMLALTMSNCSSFRVLMPNESYYKFYDDPKNKDKTFVYEEEYYDSDDDE